MKAIKNGNFITCSGFDDISILEYLQEIPATAKGHLDQERKNLQSTQIKCEKDNEDFLPSPSKTKSYAFIPTIINFEEKNTAYSDLSEHNNK